MEREVVPLSAMEEAIVSGLEELYWWTKNSLPEAAVRVPPVMNWGAEATVLASECLVRLKDYRSAALALNALVDRQPDNTTKTSSGQYPRGKSPARKFGPLVKMLAFATIGWLMGNRSQQRQRCPCMWHSDNNFRNRRVNPRCRRAGR